MSNPANPQPTALEPDLVDLADKLVEKWKADAIAIGRKRGKTSAHLRDASTVLTLRLGRDITEHERARLTVRLAELGPDEVLRQLMTQPVEEVIDWLG